MIKEVLSSQIQCNKKGVSKLGRRKKDDDWLDGLLKLGLGLLAIHFLSKLNSSGSVETTKTCTYCGHTTSKWSRMCPNCRNTFPI